MPSLGDLTPFDAAAAEAERTEADTFVFYGETFTVGDSVSSIPLMRLAKAGTSGGISEMESFAALHDFLEQTLAEGEFARFCQVAHKHKVSDDALFSVARTVYAAISGRPTRPLSSSSAGQRGTSPKSRPASSQLLRNVGISDETDFVTPDEALRLLRAV